MKCFHFTNGERRSDDGEDDVVSSGRARVSWARSLSIASSSTTNTTEVRRSEFGGESEFSGDSGGFFSLLAQNRRGCNDLRGFSFAELKLEPVGSLVALLQNSRFASNLGPPFALDIGLTTQVLTQI